MRGRGFPGSALLAKRKHLARMKARCMEVHIYPEPCQPHGTVLKAFIISCPYYYGSSGRVCQFLFCNSRLLGRGIWQVYRHRPGLFTGLVKNGAIMQILKLTFLAITPPFKRQMFYFPSSSKLMRRPFIFSTDQFHTGHRSIYRQFVHVQCSAAMDSPICKKKDPQEASAVPIQTGI